MLFRSGAVVLASGSLVKAIAMIVLGLLLGQINTDVITGTARFSFDIPELTDGIGFVVIAMGVFGFGEIIANLEQRENREVFTNKVGKLSASFPVEETDQIMLVTDKGQLIRCPVNGIRIAGRSTQGVIVLDTADDERVVAVERISEEQEGGEGA